MESPCKSGIVYAPIFESVYELAKELGRDERADLLMACCEYALEGTEPELDGMVGAIFEHVARPSMDRTLKRAQRSRENGRRHAVDMEPEANLASTHGEPKQNPEATQSEPTGNPDRTQAEPTGNPEPTKINDQRPMTEPSPKEGEGGSKGSDAPQTPRPTRRFVPPTEDEARAYGDEYAQGRGYPPGSFDVDRFMAFYESKGWKVGRSPMKDWRAAVRNSVLDEWAVAKGRASPAHRPSAAAMAAARKTEIVTSL